jgi:hypothetical protein
VSHFANYTSPSISSRSCNFQLTSHSLLIDNLSSEPDVVHTRKCLSSLPTDLLLYLFETLAKDPVSQMCLGLTSKTFHTLFHSVYGSGCVSETGRVYNSKVRPWDLRMSVSLDETAILYGWIPFHNEIHDTSLTFGQTLGDLLYNKTTLWKGLYRCEGCLKYKPDSAWNISGFEQTVLNIHQKEVNCIEAVDFMWYKNVCGRCRAKAILAAFENRAEAWEDDCEPEEANCVGLWLPDRMKGVVADRWVRPILRRLYDRDGRRYETWDEIFASLGI